MNPQPVTNVELCFPSRVAHLMPPMAEIPLEFRRHNGTRWNVFFNTWFYSGASIKGFIPKPGVDEKLAWRHIQTIAGSFEPRHEHKEAAIAYLLSLWFEMGET